MYRTSAQLASGGFQAHTRSIYALDMLALSVADIQGGVGPFLVVFLSASLHWLPERIGSVMFAAGIAGVLAQAPMGALIDITRRKRLLVILASALIAAACLTIIAWPIFPIIIAAQATISIAGAIFIPAVAAISLGLVGRVNIERRIGRNQTLIATGSVMMAVVVGLIGHYAHQKGIFYFVAVMALPCIASALLIREADIDHKLARGADTQTAVGAAFPHAAAKRAAGFRSLLGDRRVLIFSAAAILFHFANASLLTLVAQIFATRLGDRSPLYMSASVIITQLLCMLLGTLIGRWAARTRRKPIFLIAFAALGLRCLLYLVSQDPRWLVALQILDGIGAGVFGVMQVLVVADLTQGTGRFNLVLGTLGTAVGIGAALSNLLAGLIVAHAGYESGFLAMGAIALIALGVFAAWMPETRSVSATDRRTTTTERVSTAAPLA